MNRPERPNGDALDFVRDLLAEEDEERIAKLAPDALRAEMQQRGLAPARAHTLVEQVLAEDATSTVSAAKDAPPHIAHGFQERVQERDAPRVRVVWFSVAAAAAIAIALGTMARPAIVAWLNPVPPPPPVPTAPPSPSPEPREPREPRAARIRDEALAACAKRDFAPCKRGLDEAQTLDPVGENAARVREARAAIREADARPPLDDHKPKLSPP